MSLCRTFYKLDPDRLWLKLCDMSCLKEYIPPSPCLKPVKVSFGRSMVTDLAYNTRKKKNSNVF